MKKKQKTEQNISMEQIQFVILKLDNADTAGIADTAME